MLLYKHNFVQPYVFPLCRSVLFGLQFLCKRLPSELMSSTRCDFADLDTEEVYAQIQPVNTYAKEAFRLSELARKGGHKCSSSVRHSPRVKQAHMEACMRTQMKFICKTLTVSDTGTNGGSSMLRRAVEKIFHALV